MRKTTGLILMGLMLATVCSAQGGKDAKNPQIAELRKILEVRPGHHKDADRERYIDLAVNGDAAVRLFALSNIHKVTSPNYTDEVASERVLSCFRRELKERKNDVERKLILRECLRVANTGGLREFEFGYIFQCAVVGDAPLITGAQILLENFEKELIALMSEECSQTCGIARLFATKNPVAVSAGLQPWLKSKISKERTGVAVELALIASTPAEGRSLKPVLAPLGVEQAHIASLMLGKRIDFLYPSFTDLPVSLKVYFSVHPDQVINRFQDVLKASSELSPTQALSFVMACAKDPMLAIPSYNAVSKQLALIEKPYDLKIDFGRSLQYMPLFDNMLDSPNPYIRTMAGQMAMRGVGHDPKFKDPLANHYVMRLLQDKSPDVRATTRAAITAVTGELQSEIRKVLTADGVSLPPPSR